jgi:SAM-dependent methyltransferase
VNNATSNYDDVYGATFSLYSKREVEEFIAPLAVRFARNGIDPKRTFGGKRCFDAGCGGGRGTIFMLMNGADHVVAFDRSEQNTRTTLHNCERFGFKNIQTMEGDLASIAVPAEEFDFVWCNGVIQHTEKPEDCLREIARILKLGEQAWIYVYGGGGAYWYSMQRIRQICVGIPPARCVKLLKLFRYDTPDIAEYLDDWKVAHLRTYSAGNFNSFLASLGFSGATPLSRGMDYDTSERLTNSPADGDWIGVGDLRYLLRKATQPGAAVRLEDVSIDHDSRFAIAMTEQLGPLFNEIDNVAREVLLRVAVCANIHRQLRGLLWRQGRFPAVEYMDCLRTTCELARAD